jgi:hypothetical protein
LQHGNGDVLVAHGTIDLFDADYDNARNRKCRERE